MTPPTRTRLSPAQRREQLLALGTELLATHSIDELSVDLLSETAGISRGLLYHYFGNKLGFHEAVVEHAMRQLLRQTEPPPGDPVDRLLAGLAAYVDYVIANQEGFRSIVRAAAGGNETMRRIYDEAFAEFAERIFRDGGELLSDSPATRLVVRGWQAMVEESTLAWCDDPAGVSREELQQILAGALPALVGVVPVSR